MSDKFTIVCKADFKTAKIQCAFFKETIGFPICYCTGKCSYQLGAEVHVYEKYDKYSDKVINEVLGIKEESNDTQEEKIF